MSLPIDTWAPAQFVTQPQLGDIQVGTTVNSTSNNTGIDVNWQIGGTVLLALAVVWAMHYLGFRFVVGAGVGK